MPKPICIFVQGENIVFYSDYVYLDLNNSIKPGKWDKNYTAGPGRERPGAWLYPATATTARAIWQKFKTAITNDPAARVDGEFMHLVETGGDDLQFVSKTPAWEHQKRAFARAFTENGFMLALDMGTGKSKVAVDLMVNWNVKKALIICPKSVVAAWPKQFALHAGRTVDVLTLDGGGTVATKTERAKKFLEYNARRTLPAVIVINYESAWREPFKTFAYNAGFELVVADESHKIKAPGGKASKFMATLGRKVDRRLCLTGTPMPNSPLDIYGQFRFLDPTIFGKEFQTFKLTYAAALDIYDNPVKWKDLDKLNAKFYKHAERVKSGDVLDLPPTQHIEYYFELEAKARRVYDDLKHNFEAQLADEFKTTGTISVSHKLTQLLRFAQITGGWATADDGSLFQVDTGKRDLLADLFDGLPADEPIVVFCRFQKDLDTVHEVAADMRRKSLELSGRRNQLAAWQAGGAPVLAVQIQAGGAGIDLTRSAHVFYYSVGYSLGDYEQSLKRSDRPGQTRPVRFYHLIANESVDVLIYRALSNKKNVVESVLSKFAGREIETQNSFLEESA